MAWGSNMHGQLGFSDLDQDRPAPASHPKVAVVAGGCAHTLLAYEDGSLWAMGHSAHGVLGTAAQNLQLETVETLASGSVRWNSSSFTAKPLPDADVSPAVGRGTATLGIGLLLSIACVGTDANFRLAANSYML